MSALTAEKNLTRASREWIARPDDERYLYLINGGSVAGLLQ